MSLYNAIMGENPIADLLLGMLGITRGDVPRYRDCWLGEGGAEIVIHTRTGGGNREAYEEGNERLTQIAGYLGDADDDFDCTYADFRYSVPAEFREYIAALLKLNDTDRGSAGFLAVIEKMRGGDTGDARVQRALDVGQKILGAIENAASGTVVKV